MPVITEKRLYKLIKQAVSESLDEKLLQLKLAMLPEADDEEMEEIEKLFGKPEKYTNQEIFYVEDSV